MSYIVVQIFSAGGDAISESHLKSLLSQVKEGVMKSVQGDTADQSAPQETPPTKNPAVAVYVAELKVTIDRYRDSIFELLQSCPASTLLPDLTACYDKLR